MNTENRRSKLNDNELTEVVGGRPPIAIRSWEAAARFLWEDNRYLWLPDFLHEDFLYYLQNGEYSLIGDLIQHNLIQYGEDYPMLQEAFNASIIGYR